MLASKPVQILIVEDEPLVAMGLEFMLETGGFNVVGIATTEQTAFDLAQKSNPDLILMDVRLAQGGNGVRAAIVIFEQLGIRSLFVSAHMENSALVEAMKACPYGYLNKPVLSEQLFGALETALSS